MGRRERRNATGKVLNDLRRYKEAMDHFKKGNQAEGDKFDLERYRRWVNAVIDVGRNEKLTPQCLCRPTIRAAERHGDLTKKPACFYRSGRQTICGKEKKMA